MIINEQHEPIRRGTYIVASYTLVLPLKYGGSKEVDFNSAVFLPNILESTKDAYITHLRRKKDIHIENLNTSKEYVVSSSNYKYFLGGKQVFESLDCEEDLKYDTRVVNTVVTTYLLDPNKDVVEKEIQ
jgi:hypothetical protein